MEDHDLSNEKISQRYSGTDNGDREKRVSPLIYNEVQMNTASSDLLDKSIDGMERFNRVLSSRGSFNSNDEITPRNESREPTTINEESRYPDDDNDDDTKMKDEEPVDYKNLLVRSPLKSRSRNKRHPRVNISLNFTDSSQVESPAGSHGGGNVLEMSSGLEVSISFIIHY